MNENEEAAAGSPSSTSVTVAVSTVTLSPSSFWPSVGFGLFLGTAVVVMEAASSLQSYRLNEDDMKVKNVAEMGLVGTQD